MLGRHSLEWAAIARQRRCALLDEAAIERLLRRPHEFTPPRAGEPCGPGGGAPVVALPIPYGFDRVSKVA